MAVAVVDIFEKVQVDHQHSAGGIGVFVLQVAADEFLAGAVVVQLGQRVVVGLLQQFLHPGILCGDVLGVAHIDLSVRDGVGVYLPVEDAAVLCQKAEFQWAVQLPSEQGAHLPAVLGQDLRPGRERGIQVARQGLPLFLQKIIKAQFIPGGVVFHQKIGLVLKKLHQNRITQNRIDKMHRIFHLSTTKYTSFYQYGRKEKQMQS